MSSDSRYEFFNYFMLRFILACRDESKGNEAVEQIKKEFKDSDVQCMRLDLSELDSVSSFVKQFSAKFPKQKINCLVNNAGAMLAPSLTKDGFEAQYQTNYLGHFALTNWMLEKQLFSSKARIINVSSIMHWFGNAKNSIL
jgi:retinol dehydrogenase-12